MAGVAEACGLVAPVADGVLAGSAASIGFEAAPKGERAGLPPAFAAPDRPPSSSEGFSELQSPKGALKT